MYRKIKWIVTSAMVITLALLCFTYYHQTEIHWCKGLSIQYPPRAVVALASYPGSGNHWLRYLLQQATGIVTGSVYLDYAEFFKFFPVQMNSDGKALVIKTHDFKPSYNNFFESAILLIRNPKDSLLASFHGQLMGPKGTLPKSAFRPNCIHGKLWKHMLPYYAEDWRDFHSKWLQKYSGQLHVVLFSNLVRDTRGQLHKILLFLDHPVTEEDLDCAIGRGDGFARRKRHKNFNPYTLETYALLNKAVKNVSNNIILRQLAAGEPINNETQWLLHIP